MSNPGSPRARTSTARPPPKDNRRRRGRSLRAPPTRSSEDRRWQVAVRAIALSSWPVLRRHRAGKAEFSFGRPVTGLRRTCATCVGEAAHP